MIILGIHDGHDSSVALMVNGKIVYAAQEERFSRLKTDYGLPVGAIKDCLKSTGIKTKDIDEIALGTKYLNEIFIITREVKDKVSNAILTTADYSELGFLLITVTLLTLLIPIIFVNIIQKTKLKTNE